MLSRSSYSDRQLSKSSKSFSRHLFFFVKKLLITKKFEKYTIYIDVKESNLLFMYVNAIHM